MHSYFCPIFALLLLIGCKSDNDGFAPVNGAGAKTFDFEFNNGVQGWVAGFSDYPIGQDSSLELSSGWRPLPIPLQGNGFNISGNNRCDDLFMYIKRRVLGLLPNARYSLSFDVQFATNAPTGCVGIGGSPGESVTLKAGASATEPIAIASDSLRWYVMNVDKGNQTSGGENALVLGSIANTNRDCLNPVYEMKDLASSPATLVVSSDSSGGIWLYIGTDSGFEGPTNLSFVHITVVATSRAL